MSKNKLQNYLNSRYPVNKIKQIREEVIPKVFGVSKRHAYYIARGDMSNIKQWAMLAEILGCKISDIYELSNDEKSNIAMIKNLTLQNPLEAA